MNMAAGPVKTAAELRRHVQRLQQLIKKVEDFNPDAVTVRWGPQQQALQLRIDETLVKVFGENSEQLRRYTPHASLDPSSTSPPDISTIREYVSDGKARTLATLNQAVDAIEEELGDLGVVTDRDEPGDPAVEIFIVHGHDEPAKTEVARVIERAGLKEVILREMTNDGRAVIEKFEAHGGSAGFAVVLLTPDDVGGVDKDHLMKRARQNVIGEMFWFAGKLGRSRVCVLKKGEIEWPSDFGGLGYTDMDDHGAWKGKLLRELKTAGYKVDWSKAMA
jgi:Predicted nucleotide-binding protein containing TIR-like domain